MPETQKPAGGSFSKLKDLMNRVSPRSFMKSIPNSIQMVKKRKQEKELESGLDMVNKRNAKLDNVQSQSNELIKKEKITALKKIYAAMESIGVDPNDIDSIAQFREKLMQEDPDLAELFFNAFDNLTQGLEEDNAATPQSPQDLMGQATTNLQEGMMR